MAASLVSGNGGRWTQQTDFEVIFLTNCFTNSQIGFTNEIMNIELDLVGNSLILVS